MAFAFNVAMYEQKNNKLAPSFDPQPYAVVAKKGRMVSVSSAPGLGKRTIRNASVSKESLTRLLLNSVNQSLLKGRN